MSSASAMKGSHHRRLQHQTIPTNSDEQSFRRQRGRRSWPPNTTFPSSRRVLCAVLGVLAILVALERWHTQLEYFTFLQGQDYSFRLSLEPPRTATTRIARQRSHPPGDGTFNGIPIYYRHYGDNDDSPKYSLVQCLGESFQPDQDTKSHLSRSCQFHHLCFNTSSERFVLFAAPTEQALLASLLEQQQQQQQQHVHSGAMLSTSMYNKSVALGPMGKVQLVKHDQRHDLFKWFPDIVTTDNIQETIGGFYALPDNIVWIPFQVLAGQNPGHLLWDSFLVIFRLLTMFDLVGNNNNDSDDDDKEHALLLLTRMHMGQPIWGTCEMNDIVQAKCRNIMRKFLPIMGVPPDSFSTSHDFSFNTSTAKSDEKKSDLVCAKTGAAGLGLLTDHGWGQHGQDASDWHDYRFVGQSILLRQFRDFGLQNLGIATSLEPTRALQSPDYRIVFSVNSTANPTRQLDFAAEIAACRTAFADNPHVQVHAVELASMPLVAQVQFIAETSILVSATGGGTATATFLPNGASLILVYTTTRALPQYLDFAIFENAGYIQPHWIPLHWSAAKRSSVLVKIISFELERMQQRR